MKTKSLAIKAKKRSCSFNPSLISDQLAKAISLDLGISPVGNWDHSLLYNESHEADYINRIRQVSEFRKKFTIPNSLDSTRLHRLAIDDFLRRNSHSRYLLGCLDFNVDGTQRISRSLGTLHTVLLRAKAFLGSLFADFSVEEWYLGCKHSNGTTIGLKFVNTNLEDKWQFPLSTTLTALPIFLDYLAFDTDLHEALCAFNNVRVIDASCFNIVKGSRLTTVDKDLSKRRVIAIEPTVNMFLQLGLFSVMTSRMAEIGLDLSVLQNIHREKARIASVFPKEMATLDLSNASDSVLTPLVKELFSGSMLNSLLATRCTHASDGDRVTPLYIYATMGNATTFPVETLIFYALCDACCRTDNLTVMPDFDRVTVVSVFGDDIIVPTVVAPRVIWVLEQLGFTLNTEKSFFGEEMFRESCGADYYRGVNVRPYYLRAPHNDRMSSLAPWLYIICNRLIKKYISYFGVAVVNILHRYELFKTLFRLFRQHKIRVALVPADYPDDSGIQLLHEYIAGVFQNPGLDLAPIRTNRHGTVLFAFHLFQYRAKQYRDGYHVYNDDLHHATWLKSCSRLSETESKPVKVLRPHEFWSYYLTVSLGSAGKYTEKKIGGYVVSKGCCFKQSPTEIFTFSLIN